MEPTTTAWYYAKDGQQLGPVDEPTLVGMIQRDELSLSDLVWTEGLTDWTQVGALPRLGANSPQHAYPTQPTIGAPAFLNYHTPTLAPAYASFWIRFAAAFLDGIILRIGTVVLEFMVDSIMGVPFMDSRQQFATREGIIAAIINAVLAMLIGWLYSALQESSAAQGTIGKRACGIIVTDLNGERISFGRATGRHFGKLISGIILCIGYMMAGWTEKKQALHDMMAGTLVMKKPKP